ncbi:DUF2381 family protein [Corallococcus llansteffanensis]|uniref:DUF2381 family protein n=1 Tax=Corallococcus llansteffanensis TaxID=2316731 RepID=A0A3A8PDV4_9BACT|nr:DUF2381 family protein [Corallococcus llansteffanensis]RKH49894.1 DUF2381 family protein [Corallococcus llansteffanensis]
MLLFLLPLLATADAVAPEPPQTCQPLVGISTLLSEGLLDRRGIKTLRLQVPDPPAPASEAGILHIGSFRSVQRVALLIEFSEGASLSGRPFRATLSAPGLQALTVVQVLQVDPTPEYEKTRIIVEAAATVTNARGVYTLELQDAEGRRLLVLPGVRFPPA